ncbi:MAG: hypothetical protein GF384_04130 [Elusimicrobia bacterium]|nr:hypothetical protein [Elusimicrobiota bacterium]
MTIAITIIVDTRGVCFAGGWNQTDNEKMLKAASSLHLRDWPSTVHNVSTGRAQLREYWVLGLSLLMKLRSQKQYSDHLNIILGIAANAVSSILIFLIMSIYTNPMVGFVIFLLYVTTFWPYQITFVIGHIHLSQMFFLSAILCLQITEIMGGYYKLLLFILAGMFTGISFASSSASRKFPPLVMVGLMFSLREHLIVPWQEPMLMMTSNRWALFGAVAIILIAGYSTTVLLINKIAVKIKHIFTINKTQENVSMLVKAFVKKVFPVLMGISIFLIFMAKDMYPIWYAALFSVGLFIIMLHILLPISSLKKNISRYYHFLNVSSWASHFNAYPDKIKTFGKMLPNHFRGEGLPWIPRFFWRIIPVIIVLYVAGVLFILYDAMNTATGLPLVSALGNALMVIGISIMPLIISEVSGSLQVGKAYFPALIGFLFLIGKALDTRVITIHQPNGLHYAGISIVGAAILWQFVSSVYFYYTDILPGRMAPTRLRNELLNHHIKTFYTYDNPYNDSFVKTMLYSYPREFQVKYVNKLSDVPRTGYMVIPGTSSKSEAMESQSYSIVHGDFTEDPWLNMLYKTKALETLAISKLRTRGCSSIYVCETEVTGYRDLILGQISAYDRWISHGWILPAEAVHAFCASQEYAASI